VLVGRDAECARLARLLDDARRGRSGVLVVRGDAGIGKTALLDHAAAQAGDMTVVRAIGIESEAELEFSGLLEVVRPLLEGLEELPERQAAALRAALGLGPATEPDRFAIGAATLGLLAAAADRAPLLVIVDDAHWLDASSADALLFAARRLEADRVALVFATRADDAARLDAPGLETIDLTGLGREDAERLLEGATPGEMDPEVAERLWRETEGNPLALLEVPGQLDAARLAGTEPLPDPLPAGALVERAFLGRAERLGAESRRALLVAALSSSGALEPVARALAVLGMPAAALEPAEDEGLLRIEDGGIVFRHALVRSAVSRAATASERRAAHRALSAAERGEARAWHLAAAAIGPDEAAAEALEEAARAARTRSGHAAAARALERAARLSADAESRTRRLAAAAEAAWAAGRAPHAIALVEEALPAADAPPARSRLTQLRGRIELRSGRMDVANVLLVEAADLAEPDDPVRAAAILVDAAESHMWSLDTRGALELAHRARRLAPRDGGAADFLAEYTLAESLQYAGEPGAAASLERAWAILDAGRSLGLDAAQLGLAAVTCAWLERGEAGLTLARRAADLARSQGVLGELPQLLDILAWLLGRTGRWREAYAVASEGARLAGEFGQTTPLAICHTHLAWLDAMQGDDESCRANADAAIAIARDHDHRVVEVWASCAVALADLGAMRLDAVVARLEPIAARIEEHGYYDRDVSPRPNLVEAYVRLGRPDDARRSLDRYREHGVRASHVWSPAVARRCEGLLAGEDEYEALLRDALSLHPDTDPFGAARTRLHLGERLRRSGRRTEARRELRAALETFDALGGRPWSERARSELRASGERLRRDPAASEELTPQELQIALHVADGKTNRDVGAALFLSHKTVEFHLHRIYRKLGVSSRGELIRRFAAAEADVPA
jgi:DNA-binding CsgD family transcriptional regulator